VFDMLFGRRLTFTILVLISQLLLLATAITWCIQLFLVAQYGQVYFVEDNTTVLYLEIAATAIISFFSCVVFIFQIKRLGESRKDDTRL